MSPPVLRMATSCPKSAAVARNTQAHLAHARHHPLPLVRLQLAARSRSCWRSRTLRYERWTVHAGSPHRPPAGRSCELLRPGSAWPGATYRSQNVRRSHSPWMDLRRTGGAHQQTMSPVPRPGGPGGRLALGRRERKRCRTDRGSIVWVCRTHGRGLLHTPP